MGEMQVSGRSYLWHSPSRRPAYLGDLKHHFVQAALGIIQACSAHNSHQNPSLWALVAPVILFKSCRRSGRPFTVGALQQRPSVVALWRGGRYRGLPINQPLSLSSTHKSTVAKDNIKRTIPFPFPPLPFDYSVHLFGIWLGMIKAYVDIFDRPITHNDHIPAITGLISPKGT